MPLRQVSSLLRHLLSILMVSMTLRMLSALCVISSISLTLSVLFVSMVRKPRLSLLWLSSRLSSLLNSQPLVGERAELARSSALLLDTIMRIGKGLIFKPLQS